MWNEEKFQEFVAAMESDDPISKAIYCRHLFGAPSGDARVLPYLEAALNDETICIVMIPIAFADVRYEAALALASERKVQSIDIPVILRQTIGRLLNDQGYDDADKILDKNKEYLKFHYQNTDTKPYSTTTRIAAKLNFLRQAGKIELYDYEVIRSETGGCILKRL